MTMKKTDHDKGKATANKAAKSKSNTTVDQDDRTPTAASAHEMLIATGIMAAFVLVMVVIAGTGKNAGRIAVLLMFALLLNQGIRHVNPFVTWASEHPLTPDGSGPTFTVSGLN